MNSPISLVRLDGKGRYVFDGLHYSMDHTPTSYIIHSSDGQSKEFPKSLWIQAEPLGENVLERMSPYERDQQRKHIVAEFGAWIMLASGVALLVWSFFGGK